MKNNLRFLTLAFLMAFLCDAIFATPKEFYHSYLQGKLIPSQASDLTFTQVHSNSFSMSWTKGSGIQRAVFMSEGNSGVPVPLQGSFYNPNSAFGILSSIIPGSTWFCVYNDTGSNAIVTGIDITKNYRVMVCEYNDSLGFEQYNTDTTSNNLKTFTPMNYWFTNSSTFPLSSLSNGVSDWGDYDNDGDLDLIVIGISNSINRAILYRNDGGGIFTEVAGTPFANFSGGSVYWGDYDNDNNLDVLLTGNTFPTCISKVYRNMGNGSFVEQTGIVLTGVIFGGGWWNDYNNDGYLDIFIAGNDGTNRVAKLYKNNKNNTFTLQTGMPFLGLDDCNAAWGDYDNDGDMDLVYSGNNGSISVSKLYRNNGNNTFTEDLSVALPALRMSSNSWGDYDNDGDLDLLMSGLPFWPAESWILKNDGNGGLNPLAANTLWGTYMGKSDWADIDNDGDLDVVLTGFSYSRELTTIYTNEGNDIFIRRDEITLPQLQISHFSWADFDMDGDLDCFICGSYDTLNYAGLLVNQLATANLAPLAPIGLSTMITGADVTFRWTPQQDDHTLIAGLSYNLYVYENGQSTFKSSPQAFTQTHSENGLRKISSAGNIKYNPGGYTLKGLYTSGHNYHWSVQAIDPSRQGSPFQVEAPVIQLSITQASNIVCTPSSGERVELAWQSGSGDGRAVFIKQGNAGTASPADLTSYLADSVFGQGDQIGSTGWYCVYNGSGNHTCADGLDPDVIYRVMVCEYIDTTGGVMFNTFGSTNNPVSIRINELLFTQATGTGLMNTIYSGADWGDYDNDGDLDLVVIGEDVPTGLCRFYLYRNNGNGSFTDVIGWNMPGLKYGNILWGDYDNDNDLDILLTGFDNASSTARVIKNESNGVFSIPSTIALSGVSYGRGSWADYDQDGLLDIFITGGNGVGPTSNLYKNAGNDQFVLQTLTGLQSLSLSSSDWGDFDNDGDPDLMITGVNGSSRYFKLYRNDGFNVFTQVPGITIPGVERGTLSWGDYDQDGLLDILISGNTGSSRITRVYHNDGNGAFSQCPGAVMTGVTNANTGWADFDSDGDLDVFVMGWDNVQPITLLYRNDSGSIFHELVGTPFPGLYDGFATWGDYDNNGTLDFVLTGKDATNNPNIVLFKNHGVMNTPPLPPTVLQSYWSGDDIILKWNYGSDTETAIAGLTYNLVVGDADIATASLTPMASTASGYRKVVRFGNASQSDSTILKDVPMGEYFWRVQSIDNNFAGSPFSLPSSFYRANLHQARNIRFTNPTATGVRINWTRGTSDSCIVFMKDGNSGIAQPINNTNYTTDSLFGFGSTAGTGWYAVYKGIDSTVHVSNLVINHEYIVMVCEYNSNGSIRNYNDSSNYHNPFIFSSPLFVQTHQFTGATSSSVDWCDFNNDNNMDIFLGGRDFSGNTVNIILENNGDSTFTELSNLAFFNLMTPVVSWCDFNNDNFLDLMLTGGDTLSMNYFANLYMNNGNNTFSNAAAGSFQPVSGSSADWADFNQDGFMDIAISGEESPGAEQCRIYINNANGTFTELSGAISIGISNGSTNCADYDLDGYPDILLSGYNSYVGAIAVLFKNNGNNTFSEVTTAAIEGLSNGDAVWGDYDNDGDLDLISSGRDFMYTPQTILYRNNGNNTFSQVSPGLFEGLYYSSCDWGDYDNDGDLDLVMTGFEGLTPVTKIYSNEGIGQFLFQSGLDLQGIAFGDAVWGDYNNDHKLDLIISGTTGSIPITKLYTNNALLANTIPSTPSNLQMVNAKNQAITLSWNNSNDTQTPSAALTYNVVLSSTPGGCNLLSPMADQNTGYRRIISIGNAGSNNSFSIENLPDGNYYWTVQSIDNCYEGSPFAPEQQIVVVGMQTNDLDFQLGITPNPTESYSYITNPNNLGLTIRVFSVLGELLLNTASSETLIPIDFSNFPSGLYLISIKGENINMTLKQCVN